MSMKLPVLHVGFHKSGSTTLQHALFARHSEVANLGEPVENPSSLDAISSAWNSCQRDPARRMPFDLERARRLWQEALADVQSGQIAVLSKERLTHYEYYSHPGDGRLPARLRALVGPARIVIMTRHQIRLIEALYYAKTWGEISAEEWLKGWTDGQHDKDRFHTYCFNAFADAYAEAFGQENVGVFMLEELANDVASFARRLCDFIGINAEQGVTLLEGQRFHARRTRRVLAYEELRKLWGPHIHLGNYVPAPILNAFSHFLGRGQPVRVELPARWVAAMESYYRDDNRRLAQSWGVPLEKYGYPL